MERNVTGEKLLVLCFLVLLFSSVLPMTLPLGISEWSGLKKKNGEKKQKSSR